MTNKELYSFVCQRCSQITTKNYSTSFSLGIQLLHKEIRNDIYGIYGFVRLADEIVDTFHEFEKSRLLAEFKIDTYKAIKDGISLNPILQSFQTTVNKHQIDPDLIEQFFISMEMDLNQKLYSQEEYEQYIVGSAEVVGLMCLYVFTKGDQAEYKRLKEPARRLGSAFQKVNFLRDIKADNQELQRQYFPQLRTTPLDDRIKQEIESEIKGDFEEAFKGIRELPTNSRFGVFLAFKYYLKLLDKISNSSAKQVLQMRIRVSNFRKFWILIVSFVQSNFVFGSK